MMPGKAELVHRVFSSVAHRYDLMNDLMSFGLHRLWKRRVVDNLHAHSHGYLLDIAGGTGDIARSFLQAAGQAALILDSNPQMLQIGQNKPSNQPFADRLTWQLGDATDLPFSDDTFGLCSIAFGIRNIPNMEKALKEACRVLKPGGKFVCLEFSQVDNPILAKIYNYYSSLLIPQLGKLIADDLVAYQYLVDSIKQFPTPKVFSAMMEDAGFTKVGFNKFTFGVVAIHTGYKTNRSSCANPT